MLTNPILYNIIVMSRYLKKKKDEGKKLSADTSY